MSCRFNRALTPSWQLTVGALSVVQGKLWKRIQLFAMCSRYEKAFPQGLITGEQIQVFTPR